MLIIEIVQYNAFAICNNKIFSKFHHRYPVAHNLKLKIQLVNANFQWAV